MGNTMQEFYYPRDTGLIPESGRSSGVGNDNPFQYSRLGNPMDRGFRPLWGPGIYISPTCLRRFY